MERTTHLIEELKKANVPQAAFFCNTAHVDDRDGEERLLAYASAGHVIANHTASQVDIRKYRSGIKLEVT